MCQSRSFSSAVYLFLCVWWISLWCLWCLWCLCLSVSDCCLGLFTGRVSLTVCLPVRLCVKSASGSDFLSYIGVLCRSVCYVCYVGLFVMSVYMQVYFLCLLCRSVCYVSLPVMSVFLSAMSACLPCPSVIPVLCLLPYVYLPYFFLWLCLFLIQEYF